MERMQARRIPGTGQIAFREWLGYTWGAWRVAVDPVYHREKPDDELPGLFTAWGSPEYRRAVDALGTPSFPPPLPMYPVGDPPVEAKHEIPLQGQEGPGIGMGWQRALFRPDSREFQIGDIAELIGWEGKVPNVLVRLMHIARHDPQASVNVPKGFCLLTVDPIAMGYAAGIAGMVGGHGSE